MGIHISIDDFGTGYSSLSYLKRFQVNKLKIDRSFIRDIASNADDASIVQATIALAHNLRLRVVAEGVETAEQLTYLRALGCDEYQGYFKSRPLTADDFTRAIIASPHNYARQNDAVRVDDCLNAVA
jgi:EAL domain-containing protein (putative c-di-GMP-specific phosphodiesterase class I)